MGYRFKVKPTQRDAPTTQRPCVAMTLPNNANGTALSYKSTWNSYCSPRYSPFSAHTQRPRPFTQYAIKLMDSAATPVKIAAAKWTKGFAARPLSKETLQRYKSMYKLCFFVKLFLPIPTIAIDNEKPYRQNSHYHNIWDLSDDDLPQKTSTRDIAARTSPRCVLPSHPPKPYAAGH